MVSLVFLQEHGGLSGVEKKSLVTPRRGDGDGMICVKVGGGFLP